VKSLILALSLTVLGASAALAQDVCAPAKVTTISTITWYGAIQVCWTATGDDCSTGNATTYEVRYSTSPITDTNWQSATAYGDNSTTNGNQDCFCLTTGCPGIDTYYFAVFLIDETGNRSPISTVVSGTDRCSGAHTTCP